MKRACATNAASPGISAAKSNRMPGIDAKRRRTMVAAALACAIPSLAFAAAITRDVNPVADMEDGSVAMAVDFLRNRYYLKLPVVYSPVSLLQRQFRLGYGKAMALARQLEHIGFWQIDEPQPQQRVARLNAAFSAACPSLLSDICVAN